MSWCGRRDLNPHGPCGPTDFRTRLRLSPPLLSCRRVWGLDYPFTMSRICFPVVRCCPSSLYTFPTGKLMASGRAWLGIAMLQGSPNLSSSASPVSRRALKFALKSDASADSATPAWAGSLHGRRRRPQPRERPYVDSTPLVPWAVRSSLSSSALC